MKNKDFNITVFISFLIRVGNNRSPARPGEYIFFFNIFYHSTLFIIIPSLMFKALVSCGDPGSPVNGQNLGSRYWTGESVSFICHPGYRLIGPTTRMCLPSGNWSGVQPSCKLLYYILRHTMQCYVPFTKTGYFYSGK